MMEFRNGLLHCTQCRGSTVSLISGTNSTLVRLSVNSAKGDYLSGV